MYLFLFIGGALIGQLLAGLPSMIFFRAQDGQSGEEIVKSHPELKWMVITHPAVTFVSALPLFLFFWLSFWSSFKTHGTAIVFFFPLFMVQCVSLATALYEISFGATASFCDKRSTYLVHPNARNCGLARIGIFLLITIAAFWFCRLS